MSEQPADFKRRFGGIARLYGTAALERFQTAHVCVVGIGGVGSWAAEALARSAIGQLTLIDLDMVAESNVNRQIHALGDSFGKAKTDAMAERILAINPACWIDRQNTLGHGVGLGFAEAVAKCVDLAIDV